MSIEGVGLVIERAHWLPLTCSCLFASCAMSLGFYAIQQMVLADACTLVFMSPIMIYFLVRLRYSTHHSICCVHSRISYPLPLLSVSARDRSRWC